MVNYDASRMTFGGIHHALERLGAVRDTSQRVERLRAPPRPAHMPTTARCTLRVTFMQKLRHRCVMGRELSLRYLALPPTPPMSAAFFARVIAQTKLRVAARASPDRTGMSGGNSANRDCGRPPKTSSSYLSLELLKSQ
jgi:hypothetical protein